MMFHYVKPSPILLFTAGALKKERAVRFDNDHPRNAHS